VDKERFTKVLEENGAVGLNAFTSLDETAYIMSLPANKLELWFAMEADRFLNPVFREFYNERGVIREEYRMRVESDPTGRLIYEMLTVAFSTSPYRTHPAGIPSDIESYRLADAEAFRQEYYVPSNVIIGIAGDVDPKEVRRLAEKYFAKWPAAPKPLGQQTKENPQFGEKRLEVETQAQPLFVAGYKRPDATHADDVVLDVLSALLGTGRTSLFYKELVQEKKLALAAQVIASFPGSKRDNLFVVLGVPNQGKTTAELEKEMYEIMERMKTQKVSEEDLKRVKTQLRSQLISGLDSNAGMAQQLVTAKGVLGDWRRLFTQLEELDKVTADDVMAAAKKYFDSRSRTVGTLVPAKAAKSE
jgi:predicted Zn-dependent peptidase